VGAKIFLDAIKRGQLIIVNRQFSELKMILTEYEFGLADGIVADLGISSLQLNSPERGFSFMSDGPLDMRMDTQKNSLSAYDIVNTYTEHELSNIIREFGEEKRYKAIARAIVKERSMTKTQSTADLNRIIMSVTGQGVEKGVKKTRGQKRSIHPSTKTFMALRIAVNNELSELEQLLKDSSDCLRPGGVLSVVSFHSLEDRRVKQLFTRESQDCECDKSLPICICKHKAVLDILTQKPVTPTNREIHENPRARSAKLRVARKKAPN
jgi:16S rRNA (cytosine1402-N4)-methyltransferase